MAAAPLIRLGGTPLAEAIAAYAYSLENASDARMAKVLTG